MHQELDAGRSGSAPGAEIAKVLPLSSFALAIPGLAKIP
jgi:hypothetical protein